MYDTSFKNNKNMHVCTVNVIMLLNNCLNLRIVAKSSLNVCYNINSLYLYCIKYYYNNPVLVKR